MNAISEVFDIVGTNARQVATMLGVTGSTVYDWISEKRKIPHDRLYQMEDLLKVPRHFFLKKELSKIDKMVLLQIYASSVLGEEVVISTKYNEDGLEWIRSLGIDI